MNDQNLITKAILGNKPDQLVRFNHVHVITPRMNTNNGKLEHTVQILVPKQNTEDVAKIQKSIAAAQDKTFKSRGKPVPPNAWNPLRDGDRDTKQDGSPFGPEAKGCYLLTAKLNAEWGKPSVVDGALQPITDPADFISGDWGRVSVNFYGYTTGTGGVGVGLINIQKVKSGEPLRSRQSRPEDDFTAEEPDFLAA
jgi:hypothetical protein